MNKLLNLYTYLAALILSPLTAYLWWAEYKNLSAMLNAWLIPILWAYIVPWIGTNICKVWEIKSRFNLGRFRIHHGFVFGSATSLFAWLVHQQPAHNLLDIFTTSLILCSVIGFWNILYDILAIKAAILFVYNQPWAANKTAEAIVLDYAPWIFGGFGFCYGLTIASYEFITQHYEKLSITVNSLYFLLALLVCIAFPVLGIIQKSCKRYGHLGIKPVKR